LPKRGKKRYQGLKRRGGKALASYNGGPGLTTRGADQRKKIVFKADRAKRLNPAYLLRQNKKEE